MIALNFQPSAILCSYIAGSGESGTNFLLLALNPKKIRHFRFTRKSSGIVFTRATCDGPESQFNLLKHGVSAVRFKVDHLPPILTPPGFSDARAQ